MRLILALLLTSLLTACNGFVVIDEETCEPTTEPQACLSCTDAMYGAFATDSNLCSDSLDRWITFAGHTCHTGAECFEACKDAVCLSQGMDQQCLDCVLNSSNDQMLLDYAICKNDN